MLYLFIQPEGGGMKIERLKRAADVIKSRDSLSSFVVAPPKIIVVSL